VKKQSEKLIPLIATGLVPTATVTSALVSPLALGASGDLDPAYGDLGRLGPILDGPAWSLEPTDGTSTLLGGGVLEFYYYYFYYAYYTATNFVNLVSDTGTLDSSFVQPFIANMQVFDIARQGDGQVVAVGRFVDSSVGAYRLVAFRLQPDGAVDTTFGTEGFFDLPFAEHGPRQMARSVVLDDAGRIVIAGSKNDQAIVLRLLPDGSLDGSFGTSGIFAGPDTFDFSDDGSGARTLILRTATGGYRVTVSGLAGCQVFARVTAPAGATTACNALAPGAADSLLVAGNASGSGFAARLLADGQQDPGFSAGVVADAMDDATAVAAGGDGSVVVAGTGVSGASIMRLQASGELDVLFGNGGSTLIDLQSATGTRTAVHDMLVGGDGSVLAAGGEHRANKAFVVRLLGNGGGNSPGVLGITEQDTVTTAEGAAEIVVRVRRTGGASGSVSVGYQTSQRGSGGANPGEDYVHTTGTLTWEDGDTSDQQVHIPILADDVTETPEFFDVELLTPEGGAGLGTTRAAVQIDADGGPYGQIELLDLTYFVTEGQAVELGVVRQYYSTGAVSVTVTPISGTATAGDDFIATPLTLSWADGEFGAKFAHIGTVNDTLRESGESFTVELSNPVGGALLGGRTTTTVLIATSDQPSPAPAARRGGSGAVGFLSLLLLGALSVLRVGRRMLAGYRRQATGATQ
jgi:uncharacterized delta-60 repeat protein